MQDFIAGRSERLAEPFSGVLLVAALAFGGGSRGAGDAIVTFAALPVLFLACARWSWARQTSLERVATLVVASAVAWHLLQLIPLPAAWIGALPLRPSVLADLKAAGAERAWLPATLDAWGTVRSLVGLIVFGALLLLLSTLTSSARSRLLKLAVVAGCAMALLGYAQAAAGQNSLLRPYEQHHAIGALGTFANRNHFASLMAMLLPMAFALAAQSGRIRRVEGLLWYPAAVVLLLGAALSFSRTGFVLACASALIGLLLVPRRRKVSVLGVAFALLAGAGMVSFYASHGLRSRLELDPLEDLRWQYLHFGWEAAKAYFPWGSGPGSFRYVYAPFEHIANMGSVFALHAHNELIELAVEWGLFGYAFMASVIALVAMVVRNKLIVARERSPILVGSVVAVVVPMLHSLVDYPLRTYAVVSVYALAASIVLSRVGRSHGQGA